MDTILSIGQILLVVAFVGAGLTRLDNPRVKHGAVMRSTPGASNRVPLYGWIALLLVTRITILVNGVLVAGHREISDPFSLIADLFGEDARPAALAHGFICRDTESGDIPRTLFEYCAQRGTDGTFSGILLRMSGTTVSEVRLSLRENTLTLGDLVLLWGRPEVWLSCETIVASWPTRHITGQVIQRQSGRISYFSPVTSVSFTRDGHTRRGTSDWERFVTNDVSPDCRKKLM